MPVQKLTAAEVMSQILLTVEPEESPLVAWQLMSKGDIHHLPVVNAQGVVLGVLTAEELAADWSGGPAQQARRHVGDLLRGRSRPRVGPDETLASVAGTMLHAGRDAVPVVEKHGELAGLITARDIVAAVAGLLPRERGRRDRVSALFRLEPVIPPRPRIGAD
ncbi:MAG: CBS domain-containing protein [Streptosporangiales bacterium]|nr:CBS domain-containing protein [Streptosporangiales bacterium]